MFCRKFSCSFVEACLWPMQETRFLHTKSKTSVSTELIPLKCFYALACYKVFLLSYIISKLHELPIFDLPDNSCRTHLRPTGADGSEYINASFVDVGLFQNLDVDICLKETYDFSKLR